MLLFSLLPGLCFRSLGCQGLEIGQQLIEGIVNMLGDTANFGGDGHEIMILLPAWHHMKMEMIRLSCPGRRSEIKAAVKAVGPQMAAENDNRLFEHGHEGIGLGSAEPGYVSHMPGRGYEEMAVGVGKTIQQDFTKLVFIEQQALLVVSDGGGEIKNAALPDACLAKDI